MKRLAVALVVLTAMFMTGCATVTPMAFNKDAQELDTSEKSILLMSIDVSRSDDSRYVPYPYAVKTQLPNAQNSDERFNFTMNKDVDTVQEGDHTIFLARMAFTPGQYKLTEIIGSASAFPFIGTFIVPLSTDFTVEPNSVTYVGRVTAKLRPREENEFRAGPVIPLIDQAATGLSGGTWDVTIEDMYEKDLALFSSNFPVLAKTRIENKVLPPFDRAKVQRIWEDGGEQKNAQSSPEKVATSSSEGN